MTAFFIGLQFLTRLYVVKQTEWSAENFGKSVKYFTIIGAIIGIIMATLAWILYVLMPSFGIYLPQQLSALCLIIAGIVITGGLHCDGFMDTMDGVFSGRSRERMLEIMKDSRVGANGIIGFVLLVLLKWSCLIGQSPQQIIAAVFLAPFLARLNMVMGITCFSYARPEGIGKAFAVYANKNSFYIALLVTIIGMSLVSLIVGGLPFITLVMTLILGYAFLNYIAKVLGGLTGDVYGAVTELSEALVLLIFVIGNSF